GGRVVVEGGGEGERVGIREPTFGGVGRAVEQHHDVPFGDRLAVELHVPGDIPRIHGGGGFVAQDLFDGLGDEGTILGDLSALVRVVGEQLARPPDQVGGGLVAGRGEEGG